MPEALARMPRDAMLTAPARDFGPRRGKAKSSRWWAHLRPKTPGAYAALIFGAALIAVVVNAGWLQRERHPAPFFAEAPALSSQPAPAPARAPPPAERPPAAEAPAADASSASVPVRRPERAPAAAPTATPRSADAIGDLIRANAKDPAREAAKSIAAAQAALNKIGYSLKADGVMGADTEAALREFEKSKGLPASTELTPRLLKQLAAAANAGAR